MNFRILFAIALILIALGTLVYMGATAAAKEVVTVARILELGEPTLSNIRLGARVADRPISYQTTPHFELRFFVHDIKPTATAAAIRPAENGSGVLDGDVNLTAVIPVRYLGIMPDTLKAGRDVILEGHFTQGEFTASTLLTQCPSKYEVPDPDGQKGASQY